MSRLFNMPHTYTSDDWYTPAWIFDGLKLEFDIDVAAPVGGVAWIPAKTHYDLNTDGLLQPWHGLVWCNPPYSDPSLFAERVIDHNNGCFLIRADLSTRWAWRAFTHAAAIWVPRGRLSFQSSDGGIKGGSSFSSVMLGYGDHAVEGMQRLENTNGTTRLLH